MSGAQVGTLGECLAQSRALGDPSWRQFMADIASRLAAGEREYGNRSFSEEPSKLVQEIEEELLDVCGWSFILWKRTRAMRAALEAQAGAAQ